MSDVVKINIVGGIFELTLDRPKAINFLVRAGI